jgi:hypothetical protein
MISLELISRDVKSEKPLIYKGSIVWPDLANRYSQSGASDRQPPRPAAKALLDDLSYPAHKPQQGANRCGPSRVQVAE